jgi:hypothetical protein
VGKRPFGAGRQQRHQWWARFAPREVAEALKRGGLFQAWQRERIGIRLISAHGFNEL